MTITKETWRQRWLESINELTSLDLQTKSWLNKKNTNPHWSFIEFMCCYFDDILFEEYEQLVEDGWLSRNEYEIIKIWHELLDNYNSPNKDDYDNKAILDDINWRQILQKGIIAKNELLELLTLDERQYLTKEIDYLKYT